MAKQTEVVAPSSGVPTLVKVIAVLYYIAAAILILGGIGAFIGSAAFGSIFEAIPGASLFGAGMMIVLGIFLIAFAVLDFFIGRGLWKAQKWSRIVVIIISALAVISGIMSLVQGEGGIISLLVQAAIGGYLLFSKSVKAAFA